MRPDDGEADFVGMGPPELLPLRRLEEADADAARRLATLRRTRVVLMSSKSSAKASRSLYLEQLGRDCCKEQVNVCLLP